MKLLVYLTDGRTVFLLERRGRLGDLVNADPWGEQKTIRVARGIWNPITGEYIWTIIGLRYVRKASIAYVEEAPYGESSAVPPPPKQDDE